MPESLDSCHSPNIGTVTTAGGGIKSRMAMLQLDQVGRTTPRLPPRPAVPPRPSAKTPPSPPSLPPRSASTLPPPPPYSKPTPPPLPTRKLSRSSLASVSSFEYTTTTSTATSYSRSMVSGRALPPAWAGKEALPVQFPDKKEKVTEKKEPVIPTRRTTMPPPLPVNPPKSVLPALPSRASTGLPQTVVVPRLRSTEEPTPRPRQSYPQATPPPLPSGKRSAIPPIPQRPNVSETRSDPGPPPIPISSRPPAINRSTRPSISATSSSPSSTSKELCLICRDFSAADAHAARPEFNNRVIHSIQQLAIDLTTPFTSLTDKARVIFTWLHHNVAYDIDAFFGNNVRAQTPETTLRSGKAVCEGYAKLYETIARYAGMECVVIGGHGKGYGYSDVDGIPPPFDSNHAWNAVLIDNNTWHLLDACWGAGNVQGPGRYEKSFKPDQFTASNMDFGKKHFPKDSRYQFREDGRVISWEEYMRPTPPRPKVFTDLYQKLGFSEKLVEPERNFIEGGATRFRVTRDCEHMPQIRPEDEYILFLNVGEEMDVKKFIVLEPDGTGRGYEAVVNLGRGDKVKLYYVHTLEGRDGKGISRKEWESKVGRCAWGWCGAAEWGS